MGTSKKFYKTKATAMKAKRKGQRLVKYKGGYQLARIKSKVKTKMKPKKKTRKRR